MMLFPEAEVSVQVETLNCTISHLPGKFNTLITLYKQLLKVLLITCIKSKLSFYELKAIVWLAVGP
jgi:hypothetical protein